MQIELIKVQGSFVDALQLGFLIDDHAPMFLAAPCGVRVCVTMGVQRREEFF